MVATNTHPALRQGAPWLCALGIRLRRSLARLAVATLLLPWASAHAVVYTVHLAGGGAPICCPSELTFAMWLQALTACETPVDRVDITEDLFDYGLDEADLEGLDMLGRLGWEAGLRPTRVMGRGYWASRLRSGVQGMENRLALQLADQAGCLPEWMEAMLPGLQRMVASQQARAGVDAKESAFIARVVARAQGALAQVQSVMPEAAHAQPAALAAAAQPAALPAVAALAVATAGPANASRPVLAATRSRSSLWEEHALALEDEAIRPKQLAFDSKAVARESLVDSKFSGVRPRNIRTRDLISEILMLGWVEVRQRGSHRQFRHPDHPGWGLMTVPGSAGDEVSVGVLKSVLRQMRVIQ